MLTIIIIVVIGVILLIKLIIIIIIIIIIIYNTLGKGKRYKNEVYRERETERLLV